MDRQTDRETGKLSKKGLVVAVDQSLLLACSIYCRDVKKSWGGVDIESCNKDNTVHDEKEI